MAWFRRNKETARQETDGIEAVREYLAATGAEQDQDVAADAVTSVPSDEYGPWDASEKSTDEGYLDFGALRVPAIEGIQIQPDLSPDGKSVHGLNVVVGSSVVRLIVFSAPKSGDSWDELRTKTMAALTEQKAKIRERKGRWGTEIHAVVAGQLPDGRAFTFNTRVFGIQGPRWILRGDIQGPAASEEEAFKQVSQVIDQLVVFRDQSPYPPHTSLPLTIPQDLLDQLK